MTIRTTRTRPRADQTYFLGEFLGAIDRPAFWVHAKRLVAWRDAEFVNHLGVSSWLADAPGVPRMTRVAVNQVALEPSRRVLRVLGFRAKDRPMPRPGLAFELTVLDRELYPLAPWLVEAIEGRIDPARMIPPPSVESDLVTEEDLHAAGRVWSDAAWRAHCDWLARQDAQEAARRARWQDWLLHGSGGRTAAATTASATSVDTPTAVDRTTTPAVHAQEAT